MRTIEGGTTGGWHASAPPIDVRVVRDSDEIAGAEAQLVVLGGLEVVQRLDGAADGAQCTACLLQRQRGHRSSRGCNRQLSAETWAEKRSHLIVRNEQRKPPRREATRKKESRGIPELRAPEEPPARRGSVSCSESWMAKLSSCCSRAAAAAGVAFGSDIPEAVTLELTDTGSRDKFTNPLRKEIYSATVNDKFSVHQEAFLTIKKLPKLLIELDLFHLAPLFQLRTKLLWHFAGCLKTNES